MSFWYLINSWKAPKKKNTSANALLYIGSKLITPKGRENINCLNVYILGSYFKQFKLRGSCNYTHGVRGMLLSITSHWEDHLSYQNAEVKEL